MTDLFELFWRHLGNTNQIWRNVSIVSLCEVVSYRETLNHRDDPSSRLMPPQDANPAIICRIRLLIRLLGYLPFRD
jgi:hypothetical protein